MSQDSGHGKGPGPGDSRNPARRVPNPANEPTEPESYELSDAYEAWEPPAPTDIYDDDNVFHASNPNTNAQPPREKPKPAVTRPEASPSRTRSGTSSGFKTMPNEDRIILTKGPTFSERILFGTVGSGQPAVFCRQFAAYLEAGVDIMKALSGLEGQFAKTALGPVIGRLQNSIRAGEPLTEAMAREPQAFDKLMLSMIGVAEMRGGVPETLKGLAKHYEARLRLMRQARSAMIYPVIVLIVASVVIAILTIYVLPGMASMLVDIAPKVDLPLPSRVLIGISNFMQANGWWLVPLVAFGSGFGLLRMYRSETGKAILDQVFLHTPVLKGFVRKIDTSRFARTLASLLEAGVDMGSSLDLTSSVLYLAPYRRAVRDIRVEVMEGSELSEAIDNTRRFTPDVIAIVNSGEETGKLPETLDKLADEYEEQVEYMVKNMSQLIQPLLMVFMGLIVLFIILAVILPYIQMLSSLGNG